MTDYRKKGAPTPGRATREHLRPRSQGGKNGDNVVLACSRCNDLKSLMAADVFATIARTLPPPLKYITGGERRALLARFVTAAREKTPS
jgi:hypothetical protein